MHENLKDRTKAFAVRIIKLAESLDNSLSGRTIANQIIRCGTSVAANYRAAARGRSKADFIAKLGIVEEECDETLFWLELIVELELLDVLLLSDLMKEAGEILAIVVSSKKTARKNIKS